MFSYSSNIYNSIRKISKCFIQSVAPQEDGVSVIHHRLCKTIEQYYTRCRATRCSKFSCVPSGSRILEVERFEFLIMTWVLRTFWSFLIEHGTHLIVSKLFNIIIGFNFIIINRITTRELLCQSTTMNCKLLRIFVVYIGERWGLDSLRFVCLDGPTRATDWKRSSRWTGNTSVFACPPTAWPVRPLITQFCASYLWWKSR